MKIQKPIVLVLSFFGFLLLYVLVGFVLWRVGFLPYDQSFMERVVTVVFLFMICLSPLGILAALSLTRSARKQDAEHNTPKAQQLRRRGLESLMKSLAEAGLGAAGYYLVSRRVFPKIDVTWILLALILPPAILQVWFRLRWNSLKQQQLRNQVPPQTASIPE